MTARREVPTSRPGRRGLYRRIRVRPVLDHEDGQRTGTDEQRYYWNVVEFVRGLVRTEPVRVPALLGKMESEIRARFPVAPAASLPAA